jgi:peptide/nickel transport system substrate-binding protein
MKTAPRIVILFGLLLLVGVAVSELTAWTAAQPPKRVEEEEEGDPKKTPPGKRTEEEDSDPKIKRKVVRPDDPDTPPKKPAEGLPADLDLKSAARQAKHIFVRKLFRELAIPHDSVTIKNDLIRDREQAVAPLKDYIADPEKLKGSVPLTFLDASFHPEKKRRMSPTSIRRVKPFEVLAQEAVDEFLERHLERYAAARLPVPDQLAAAELALSAVLRYHESAREKETRVGDEWDKVRDGLRAKLLDVVLRRLSLAIDEGNWDAAFAQAKAVAGRFPDPKDQVAIAKRTAVLVEKALDSVAEGRFKEVQRRLREFEDQFPGSKATEPVRKKLSDLAGALLARAEQAKKHGRPDEARQLIRQAEEIYPSLPGLRDLRLEVEEGHPTLRVGVRELPIFLSPALAWSEAERQAVELLFEGLVKLSPEPAGGRYRPALALGRPQIIPLGRQFTLPQGASWSDGRPITAADVQSTVQLLNSRDWEGRTPAWADDLFDEARYTDPFHVQLTLRRGYLAPLALMDFKVLPSQMLQRADDEKFAKKNPVGSGPFTYMGQASNARGRPFAKFLANPYYRIRAGHTGLPRIQEIQFYETQDPVKDFKEGNLDLLLDLPASKMKDMAAVANVTVPAPLPNRRIYFLAINHRHPDLADAHLRRALALAINRQELLDKCFRATPGESVHRPLNGPYPLGSWACNPEVEPKFLDDAGKAKAQLEQSKKKNVRLTLKYPSDDPQAAAAMEYLVKQVKNTIGVDIQLRGLPLRRLHEDVEGDQDYELAYYWYDYPDQTYWLWPLLDPRSANKRGRNYLGFRSGSSLEKEFRKALGHRDFAQVRTTTHTIHRIFVVEEMPFIPLWQLDRYIAVHNDLRLHDGTRDVLLDGRTPAPLDPLRLFSTVEYWRLRRK